MSGLPLLSVLNSNSRLTILEIRLFRHIFAFIKDNRTIGSQVAVTWCLIVARCGTRVTVMVMMVAMAMMMMWYHR